MHRTAEFVAAGFGSGWLPWAPGSWGSLASLLPAWWIVHRAGTIGLFAAVVLLLPVACWACREALGDDAGKDPGWVVVDEWLGQWLCLGVLSMAVSIRPGWLAAAFAAFRLFDVLKPWPVSAVEHLGPAWWSIQTDDLLAGLMGGVLLVGIASWL